MAPVSLSMKADKQLSVTWTGVGCERNRRINPMLLHMHRAKLCGARTRSGKPCQSPAMTNGRCRMHGGPGAPKGNRNAFKHGRSAILLLDVIEHIERPTEFIASALQSLPAVRWLIITVPARQE